MSCRTRSGGSAAITVARMLSGLDDQQTISIYHRLSHAQSDDTPATPDAIRRSAARLRSALAEIPGATEARQRSILRRLERMPDESYTVGDLEAIAALTSTAQRSAEEVDARISIAARSAGVGGAEVRSYVDRVIESVRESGRSAGPSRRERFSGEASVTGAPLPRDRGTQVAMADLMRSNSTWRCAGCGRFRDPDVPHECPSSPASTAPLPPAVSPTSPPPPPRRAQRFRPPPTAYEAERDSARRLYEEAQAQRREEWAAAEHSSWSTDEGGMDLFQAAYSAARARKANGEPAVPLDLESPGFPGRKFGIEIEFNLSDRSAAAKDRLMSRLREAGIFEDDARWERYHGPSRERRNNGQPVWSIENDCTVDGELVTPPLDDTPENWEKIATVCKILRECGALAGNDPNQPTGGHIHVSLGDFDHAVESHDAILRTWGEHNDTLWRLSSRHDGPHRSARFCNPDAVAYGPHPDVSSIRRTNSGHHTTINFDGVTGRQQDHVEYRAWDETLDPGTIQAQVRLSLAITEAALRDPAPSGAPMEQIGSHLQQYRSRRLSGDEWRDSTRPVRNLVDKLFADDRHKEQIAALFSTTRWQRGR